jgi:predicted GTPase
MGYGQEQIAELTETINRTECDLVIGATPIDLGRLIQTDKRILPVSYDLEEIGTPDLQEVLKDF